MRKTSLLLAALARLINNDDSAFPINYYALDLEKSELERTLGEIEQSSLGRMLQDKVETKGICGTYDDGLKFLSEGGLHHTYNISRLPDFTEKFTHTATSPASVDSGDSRDSRSTSASSTLPSSPGDPVPPFHILFLGSSLGNFPRADAVKFLRGLPLRPGYGDTLLIGLDHNNSTSLVEKAYNDSQGHTREFIMNGLRAAGRVLGNENLFDEKNWDYVNKYNPVSPQNCIEK